MEACCWLPWGFIGPEDCPPDLSLAALSRTLFVLDRNQAVRFSHLTKPFRISRLRLKNQRDLAEYGGFWKVPDKGFHIVPKWKAKWKVTNDDSKERVYVMWRQVESFKFMFQVWGFTLGLSLWKVPNRSWSPSPRVLLHCGYIWLDRSRGMHYPKAISFDFEEVMRYLAQGRGVIASNVWLRCFAIFGTQVCFSGWPRTVLFQLWWAISKHWKERWSRSNHES